MMLRRLEPIAIVVVTGAAYAVAGGVVAIWWCKGAWLKAKDALS